MHYSVFNSSFLQPDIATAAGLTRSKTQGVLNIAALKDGKAARPPRSAAQVKNLLGQTSELKLQAGAPRAAPCTTSPSSR